MAKDNLVKTYEGEIPWINSARAICMLLVYFYHTSVYCGYPSIGFVFYSPFFVTSFFFISGYLFFNKHLEEDGRVIGGRISTSCLSVLFKIVLPTIFFASINYVPKVLLRGQGFQMQTFLRDTLLGGSLWFTSALAVAELLLFTLVGIMRRKYLWLYLVISALLAASGILLAHTGLSLMGDNNIPWYYKAGLIGTLYLVVGGMYKRYENKVDSISKPVVVFALLIYSYITLSKDFKVWTAINGAHINVMGLMVSMLGILLLIELCKRIPHTVALEWTGRRTLVMYFLSGGIPNVLSIIINKMGVETCFLTYLFICALSFIMGVLGSYIIDKYMPFVLDIRKIKFSL